MVSLDLGLDRLPADRARHIVNAARAGFIVTFIGVTVLSLIPGKTMSDVNAFGIDDKIGHFLCYAGLGFFTMFSLRAARERLIGLAALALYGAALEVMQRLLDWEREGSVGDLFADTLGLAAGAAVALAAANLLNRRMTGGRPPS